MNRDGRTYTVAGVTVFMKKEEQSAEPCLVVNALAGKGSDSVTRWDVSRHFTNDSTEAIIPVTRGDSSGSCCQSNAEEEGSSRETHVWFLEMLVKYCKEF